MYLYDLLLTENPYIYSSIHHFMKMYNTTIMKLASLVYTRRMRGIEQAVLSYLTERGWDKLRPSDVAKSISIEAAELLEIFQWSSMSIEETKADPKKMDQIKKELADVFIYAFDMAVLLDLDTETIIKEKLEFVRNKYPAPLMKASAQEGPGSGNDAEYLRIKEEHRVDRK